MPYWADRATAALARDLNSLRKDIAVLILLARSVLEDFVMRHINTTLYVILSSIIPTPLIPNYMGKLEVIFCVRGVLSPLLSNLMLDVLDKELERCGHRFVRYADDCNIYVRSERAGERVMAGVSRFLEKKLKLKVNRAKSAVARPEERKFLGFTFTFKGALKRRIAPQSLKRFKLRIRELTCAGRHLAPAHLVNRLKLFLTGWRGYFGFCETPSVLRKLDSWLRRRLRMVFWRQWKRGRSRFAALRRLGVGRDLAAKAAGSAHGPWRLSRSPALSFALPNTYFISLGLPTLAPGR
jgi:RNA-directed DNA polymerase